MTFKNEYKNIKIRIIDKVILITLNRPEALNALSSHLIDDLNHALGHAEQDKNISLIVLTGSSKAFAAGADIKEMSSKSFTDLINDDFIKPWEKISLCKKPTIAAVDGYALGGGCELAMMCDLLIANKNTKFGQPEINLGVFPAAGGTQRLPKAIGKAKAMDMILSGRMMGAEEAEKLGLVSRIISNHSNIPNIKSIKINTLAKKVKKKHILLTFICCLTLISNLLFC